MDYTEIIEFVKQGGLLNISIAVVAVLIAIVGIVGAIISIWLAIKYVKYNRTENSAGLTGKDAARKILDDNGLTKIKVKATGSLLFGNSYSHYFKKVRLRRLTWKKSSVASLAMAAQKSALAVLDKEGDPDMKQRIKLVPLVTFGPFMLIPLVIVGVILDFLFFNMQGYVTLAASAVGLLFYVYSVILSVKTLKTEKKAQERAYKILHSSGMATSGELAMMKELFHLYNIEYINNIIMSVLELIYRILQIVASAKNISTSKN